MTWPWVSRAAFDAVVGERNALRATLEAERERYHALVQRVTGSGSVPDGAAVGPPMVPRVPDPLPQPVVRALALTSAIGTWERRLAEARAQELLAAGYAEAEVGQMILKGLELPV
jgi:hypothetical protein